MDLRFEAAAANEYAENTQRMMQVLGFLLFIGILQMKNVMTLDWVDGVSIRETEVFTKTKY